MSPQCLNSWPCISKCLISDWVSMFPSSCNFCMWCLYLKINPLVTPMSSSLLFLLSPALLCPHHPCVGTVFLQLAFTLGVGGALCSSVVCFLTCYPFPLGFARYHTLSSFSTLWSLVVLPSLLPGHSCFSCFSSSLFLRTLFSDGTFWSVIFHACYGFPSLLGSFLVLCSGALSACNTLALPSTVIQCLRISY